MSQVKLLIVEDEMIIAHDMKMMLESIGYHVCGIARSVNKAVELLDRTKPDLMLIDINLGRGLEGIALSRIVQSQYRIPFIFCTSHSDSATVSEAKQMRPSGYLVKPFDQNDLYTAIEVALVNFSGTPPQESKEEIVLGDCLFIKEGRLFTKVVFDDILWVQQDRNYVEIHTDGRVHPIRSTLKEFIKCLPEKRFFQVHRSFLVNVIHITAINGDVIRLKEKEVPVSKNYRDDLLSKLRLLS